MLLSYSIVHINISKYEDMILFLKDLLNVPR